MSFHRAGLQVSVVGLERALNAYVEEAPDAPFDMKTVPLATASMQEQMAKPGKPSMTSCSLSRVLSYQKDMLAESYMA